MSNEKVAVNTVSRRDFLNIAAVGTGAVLAIGLAGSPAVAGTIPKNAARYQPSPHAGQRCDNCALFQSPSDCKLVQGPIAPSGWCSLYVQKH